MDPTDPAYLNILRSLLRAEHERNKTENEELRAYIKDKAMAVRGQIAYRKTLKAEIAKSEERLQLINAANDKMRQNINDMKFELECAKAGQDSATKVSVMHLQEYKNVLKEFEDTWAGYEARYEQLPLAKERKQTKIDLQEAQKEKIELGNKIKEKEKQRSQMSHSNWKTAQAMTVEFSELWINHQKNWKVLIDSQAKNSEVKTLIGNLKLELKALQEKDEELNKKEKVGINLPKIDPIFVQPAVPINCYRRKKQKVEKMARSPSEDSLSSFNSAILEEMCMNVEKTVHGVSMMEIETTATTATDQPRQEGITSKFTQRETENSVDTKRQNISMHRQNQQDVDNSTLLMNEPRGPEAKERDYTKQQMPAVTVDSSEDKTSAVKKQQPKIISVERQKVKIILTKPQQEQEGEYSGAEESIVGLKNHMNADGENMILGEASKSQTTFAETEVIAEKRKVLPEFTPHEAEPVCKKGKPSEEVHQPSTSQAIEITQDLQRNSSPQTCQDPAKSNTQNKETTFEPFTTFRDGSSSNFIPGFDDGSMAGIDTNSMQDSLFNLKISDCSVISRFPYENAVDNSSTCDECAVKQDEVNKEGDGNAMDFNFAVNPGKGGMGNFQLF